MNYFISRDTQEYGPYTLADLQRYAASGEIALTDLAHGEGLTELTPVAQIIGTIPAPARPLPNPAPTIDYPDPPNLHWGLVLLFSILTCGIFEIVWEIILAAWIKRLEPLSKALVYLAAAAVCLVLIFFASLATAANPNAHAYTTVFNLAYTVLILVGRFSLRNTLEQHFNTAEPLGLGLSGVMTFFFGGIYFQYHLNRIVQIKNAIRMGIHTP